MARTYYNAGPNGRDYSDISFVAFEDRVVVMPRNENNVALNREQVRDLRDRLTVWLGDTPHPGPTPMMEGDL